MGFQVVLDGEFKADFTVAQGLFGYLRERGGSWEWEYLENIGSGGFRKMKQKIGSQWKLEMESWIKR